MTQKLEWIPCFCKQPLRVVHIGEKQYVHPDDLEHMRICPNDDPKVIRENEEAVRAQEEYY